MEKTKLNYSDEKCARFVTNISGWVDINNRFWGDGKDAEHMARYSSCTHSICDECGGEVKKGWSVCPKCRQKKSDERYNNLPFREYTGETVYSHAVDEYFMDENEIEDYLSNNDEIKDVDLQLVFCKENKVPYLKEEYFSDELPEDGEMPKALSVAIEILNKTIDTLPAISFSPASIRTTFNLKEE